MKRKERNPPLLSLHISLHHSNHPSTLLLEISVAPSPHVHHLVPHIARNESLHHSKEHLALHFSNLLHGQRVEINVFSDTVQAAEGRVGVWVGGNGAVGDDSCVELLNCVSEELGLVVGAEGMGGRLRPQRRPPYAASDPTLQRASAARAD